MKHGADLRIKLDQMGGLAQHIIFSIMARTPILVWEHEDEPSFRLSSTITRGVTEWTKFTIDYPQIISNPHNIIIHVLYNRRATLATSHYDILVVFNGL